MKMMTKTRVTEAPMNPAAGPDSAMAQDKAGNSPFTQSIHGEVKIEDGLQLFVKVASSAKKIE